MALPLARWPPAAALDVAVSSLPSALRLAPKFFEGGWGDLNVVDLSLESPDPLVSAARAAADAGGRRANGDAWSAPPPYSDDAAAGRPLHWQTLETGYRNGVPYTLAEATFPSPVPPSLAAALPPVARLARARLLAPADRTTGLGAAVVHLAGTGDHGFARRLALGAPLLGTGVATIVLESPYYGGRRPPHQAGSRLARVSDLLALGRATIGEALHLCRWSIVDGGWRRVGVAGLSMGGVHAGMVTALAPGPLGELLGVGSGG